jgi:NAD(P)-dependent dehydrogenase (short-subunit alcohol dehydrogenase family)
MMEQRTDVLPQKVKGLVVIMGCDSGIGKSLAQRMAEQGYKVVISYLDENHFQNNPLHNGNNPNLAGGGQVFGDWQRHVFLA